MVVSLQAVAVKLNQYLAKTTTVIHTLQNREKGKINITLKYIVRDQQPGFKI